MSRLRIAMIGTDREALRFYEANRYGTGIEVTAVCGATDQETRDFAARKGRLALFTDPEDLAASSVCDAVFVSGRCSFTAFLKKGQAEGDEGDEKDGITFYHRNELLSLLLEQGKHVICQPPLALKAEEARELFKLAEQKDLVLMEAFHAASTPAFAKMKDQACLLGTFREAYIQCCHRTPAYESFKRGACPEDLMPEMGGGALYSYGIHMAACAIRLFGQPERVSAFRHMLKENLEGSAVMMLHYPDMPVTISCSMMADLAAPSHILGEDGSMLISNMENVKDLQVYRPAVKQVFHYEQSDNTYGPVTQLFAGLVRGEGDPASARELSLGAIEILEKARDNCL